MPQKTLKQVIIREAIHHDIALMQAFINGLFLLGRRLSHWLIN